MYPGSRRTLLNIIKKETEDLQNIALGLVPGCSGAEKTIEVLSGLEREM